METIEIKKIRVNKVITKEILDEIPEHILVYINKVNENLKNMYYKGKNILIIFYDDWYRENSESFEEEREKKQEETTEFYIQKYGRRIDRVVFTYKETFINSCINDNIEIMHYSGIKNEQKFIEILEEIKEVRNNNFLEKILETYIEIDKDRFRGKEYKEEIYDINKGSWDLYDNSENDTLMWYSSSDNYDEIELNRPIYARNPKYDIVESGVVGIDFGTKSTVVVSYRDDNAGINDSKTLPIRISGNNSEIERAENYENRTIIHFDDSKRFWDRYNVIDGRPHTFNSDIQVSFEAENILGINEIDINEFMFDLKQWAASKNIKKQIIDSTGTIHTIDGYLNLKEDDLDPIEIYAYYIGCRVNDMAQNAIFLEYLLSFPVTYELEVKNKILKSFEKGLKKSLPISILEDEEIMKRFRVSFGASEPASYAITALKKFCIEPDKENEIGYAVFDFGGGTTDFSYGIYREKENSKKYDYEIQELESGGDKYLGGENLLSLIAFDVFAQNRTKLMSENYNIVLPINKKREIGDETFVSTTSEAETNMKMLMEAMRGYWEGRLAKEEINKGKIVVNLINREGTYKGVELDVDYERLDKILENKIYEGVLSFVEKFKTIFKNKKLYKIYIFLAGNSSKSKFVEESFNKLLTEEIKTEYKIELKDAYSIEGIEKNKKENVEDGEYDFEDVVSEELDERKYNNTVIGLNSKTGVAFGLVELREGNGEIEYIPYKNSYKNEEIDFKYCIGYSKKRSFVPIIKFDTEYNKWIKYDDILEDEKSLEILYSGNTRAESDNFPASECLRIRVLIQENEKGALYIRIKNPNTIEHIITEDINNIDNNSIVEKELK